MTPPTLLPLTKYVLSREQILGIPATDRALMIWCGHIHNELMTLLGLFRAVGNTEVSSAVEREAQIAQQLTVVKTIAGKLWESWELLRKGFFSGLAKTYEPLLDAKTKRSLDVIKGYFGRTPPLHALRNHYAFHYAFGDLCDLPDKWDSVTDELTFYVGPVPSQTLFVVSEAIVNRSMFVELGAGNLADGVQRFWADIAKINEALIAVSAALFGLVVQQHVGGPSDIDNATIGVVNSPPMEEPFVPFFVTLPSKAKST